MSDVPSSFPPILNNRHSQASGEERCFEPSSYRSWLSKRCHSFGSYLCYIIKRSALQGDSWLRIRPVKFLQAGWVFDAVREIRAAP